MALIIASLEKMSNFPKIWIFRQLIENFQLNRRKFMPRKVQMKEGLNLINEIQAIEKWAMNGLKNGSWNIKGCGFIKYKKKVFFEK